MIFFKQIIFDPLPKSIISVSNMKYYFKTNVCGSDFIVECPVCKKEYCYAVIKITSDWSFLENINENMTFFQQEWERHCPDYSIHSELGEKKYVF